MLRARSSSTPGGTAIEIPSCSNFHLPDETTYVGGVAAAVCASTACGLVGASSPGGPAQGNNRAGRVRPVPRTESDTNLTRVPGKGLEPLRPRAGTPDFKSGAYDQFRHPGAPKDSLAARRCRRRLRGSRAWNYGSRPAPLPWRQPSRGGHAGLSRDRAESGSKFPQRPRCGPRARTGSHSPGGKLYVEGIFLGGVPITNAISWCSFSSRAAGSPE
jgi:hypothetical protein